MTSLDLEFDEASGSTFADSSGYGNVANVLSGGVISGASGHANKSASFAGGAVVIAAPTKIPDSPQVWVEAWINPQLPLTGARTIATKPGSYTLQLTGADVQFAVTPAGTGTPCTASSTGGLITAGNWQHVGGWYDGLNVTVALNGRVLGTASCPNGPVTPTPNAPFNIGAQVSGTTTSATFNGAIDELRVRQLAAQQYSPRGACPPGYADLGTFCIQQINTPTATYPNALQGCYGSRRRLCTQSELAYACTQRASAGITFADGEWNWADGAQYIYWSPGNYYQAYMLFRMSNGQCFGGSGANPAQANVSWDYANANAYVARCCVNP